MNLRPEFEICNRALGGPEVHDAKSFLAAIPCSRSTSVQNTFALTEFELVKADRDVLQLWQKKHANKLKGERSKRLEALISLNLDLDSAKVQSRLIGDLFASSTGLLLLW